MKPKAQLGNRFAHMKASQYASLTQERKGCTRCVGLQNPSQVEQGKYDSEHIGPWSLWQGNLNADIMVIGQDWGDVEFFTKNKGADPEGNPTNQNLAKLLRTIGVEIGSPGTPTPSPVFLTNAVLCLKDGGLQGPTDREWFTNCGYYLQRLYQLVNPVVVVTVGKGAFDCFKTAVYNSADWTPPYAYGPMSFREEETDGIQNRQKVVTRSFKANVELEPGIDLPCSKWFPVYHCGARSVNMNRKWEQQVNDWSRIKRFYSEYLAMLDEYRSQVSRVNSLPDGENVLNLKVEDGSEEGFIRYDLNSNQFELSPNMVKYSPDIVEFLSLPTARQTQDHQTEYAIPSSSPRLVEWSLMMALQANTPLRYVPTVGDGIHFKVGTD